MGHRWWQGVNLHFTTKNKNEENRRAVSYILTDPSPVHGTATSKYDDNKETNQ